MPDADWIRLGFGAVTTAVGALGGWVWHMSGKQAGKVDRTELDELRRHGEAPPAERDGRGGDLFRADLEAA